MVLSKSGCILPLSIIVVASLLVGWRKYQLWKLPFDEVQLQQIQASERLEIPTRPGIQGIVITGPAIESIYFSIDLTKAGIRSLDWRRLQAIDPHADVKVSCYVDNQGQLSFTQDGVLTEGHTEAGIMIQRALRTWLYTPYRTGIIRFWFNLPSRGKKLIIDTSGLSRRGDIPRHVPIFDGRLHFIEGIPSEQLTIIMN